MLFIILWSIFFFASGIHCQDLLGFEFQTSNVDAGVVIPTEPGIDLSKGFTVCVRVLFYRLNNNTILSNNNTFNIGFYDYKTAQGYFEVGELGYYYQWPSNEIKYLPYQWYSFCILLDVLKRDILFFVNQKIVYHESDIKYSLKMSNDAKTILVGDSQFPFLGKISDLNFWNKPISVHAIQEFANGNNMKSIYDNLPIQWSTLNAIFTKNYINKIIITREEIFNNSSKSTALKLFSSRINFQQAHSFCQNLNGSMVLPANKNELDLLFLLQPDNLEQNCNGMIWINAVHSKSNVSLWFNGSNTSEVIKYLPWVTGQPNGNGVQNCVSSTKDGYSDNDCQKERCFICKMSKYPIFHLRGPYTNSQKLDTKYVFLHDWKNNPDYIFQGLSGLTRIVGSISGNSWDFLSFADQNKNFSLIARIDNLNKFPFGTKNWTKTANDGKHQNTTFLMKLSMVLIRFT